MKNIASVIFISCLSMTNVYAQNLVPNPDFEIRDADFCGIAGSSDLGNSLSNWYSPTDGSPDVYFTDISSSCWNFQPNSTYSGVIGLKGEQLPRSGSSMVGLSSFTIQSLNQREYIQVQLSSALVPSGTYLIEFYVSLADSVEAASNRLGFCLSTTAISSSNNGVLGFSPQYETVDVIFETQSWVRVFDTITVTDGFEYLTIGNFVGDAGTTALTNPTSSLAPGTYGAYYFIDDVRVERVFTDVSSINELETIDVRVFPNPTMDKITVELPSGDDLVEIQLADLNGSVIWSVKDRFQTKTINMKEYADGIYFICVKNSKGSFTEKIMKR